MKPNDPARTLQSSGSTASATFGIDEDSEVHIMTILRDTLYSDKILAVLREYSANAWDAHRAVNKNELPIEVSLPTLAEPTLRIRDWGPGLSPDEVLKVYTKYGKSSKRNDDNSVGMLGIGCKSAFAYTDTFTITSWHGGMKRIYVAVLDETNRGLIELKHEEDLGTLWETGIEISVGVNEDDVDTFHERAYDLFQHFIPRPKINCELPEPPAERTALVHGTIDYVNDIDENGTWIATMGCIPYKMRLDQLDPAAFGEVWPCLRKLAGTLTFKIGEVQINPSREGLNYTKKTKAAITQRFTELLDEYVAQTLAVIEGDTLNDWQKRVRLIVLETLELPLPKEWAEWAKSHVKLFDDGDTQPFYMLKDSHVCSQVAVSGALKIYLDDADKELAGYGDLDGLNHYVMRRKVPEKKQAELTIDELRMQVETLLDACGLKGVPVELISTLSWEEPERKGRRKYEAIGPRYKSPKHRASMFVLDREILKGNRGYLERASDEWEVTVRIPQPDDVYVIIEGFRGRDYGTKRKAFYILHDETAEIAAMFGRTMPTIYGYKHTKKKPVDAEKLVGVEFREWREKFLAELVDADDVFPVLRARKWIASSAVKVINGNHLRYVGDDLGDQHPIVTFMQTVKDTLAPLDPSKHDPNTIDKLLDLTTQVIDDPAKLLSKVLSPYPLVKQLGINRLWEKSYSYYSGGDIEPKDLREYVKLVDYRNANNITL